MAEASLGIQVIMWSVSSSDDAGMRDPCCSGWWATLTEGNRQISLEESQVTSS